MNSLLEWYFKAPLRKGHLRLVPPEISPEQYDYETGLLAGEVIAHAASWNIHMTPEQVSPVVAHNKIYHEGVNQGIRNYNKNNQLNQQKNNGKLCSCNSSSECTARIQEIRLML